jgi:maltose phosphorylase
MYRHLKSDPWKIIEDGFDPLFQIQSERIFSIANGKISCRANFEEDYSGETIFGNYIAGICSSEKTKNDSSAFPVTSNWFGVHITVNDKTLDLHSCKIHSFKRILHLNKGYLERIVSVETSDGSLLEIQAIRFLSMAWNECGGLHYSISSLQDDTRISVESFLKYHIHNPLQNETNPLEQVREYQDEDYLAAHIKTLDSRFDVCSGMHNVFYYNGKKISGSLKPVIQEGYVSQTMDCVLQEGDSLILEKSVCEISSLDYEANELGRHCIEKVKWWSGIPFEQRLNDHQNTWNEIWDRVDVRIEGDEVSQQSIRYHIFQLYQNHPRDEIRFSIGRFGIGSATGWETEIATCPFFMSTANVEEAKQLLIYRYNQLGNAIGYANKLGFTNGAALYPVQSMNGNECGNENDSDLEAVYTNGLIVYSHYFFTNLTGDKTYVLNHGIDVIIAINRFWVQRVHFSNHKHQYVINGVAGPNSYEYNVNNNWFTSYIAKWSLGYGLQLVDELKQHPESSEEVFSRNHLTKDELNYWKEVADKMYLPEEKSLHIFLQQDDYLDKEQMTVLDLSESDRPLCKNWSRDRILRSCFIEQADVLLGIYLFESHFDSETIKRNFEFYESRTVHENQLSYFVHSILAAKINKLSKAHEWLNRSLQYDLYDLDDKPEKRLHLMNMAGSWLAIVYGLAGLRIMDDAISIKSLLPETWNSFSFNFMFRNQKLKIKILATWAEAENHGNEEVKFFYKNKTYIIAPGEVKTMS